MKALTLALATVTVAGFMVFSGGFRGAVVPLDGNTSGLEGAAAREGGELRSGRLLLLPGSGALEMHGALLSSLGFKSTIINKILPV